MQENIYPEEVIARRIYIQKNRYPGEVISRRIEISRRIDIKEKLYPGK